jgi:hypothetical protein
VRRKRAAIICSSQQFQTLRDTAITHFVVNAFYVTSIPKRDNGTVIMGWRMAGDGMQHRRRPPSASIEIGNREGDD